MKSPAAACLPTLAHWPPQPPASTHARHAHTHRASLNNTGRAHAPRLARQHPTPRPGAMHGSLCCQRGPLAHHHHHLQQHSSRATRCTRRLQRARVACADANQHATASSSTRPLVSLADVHIVRSHHEEGSSSSSSGSSGSSSKAAVMETFLLGYGVPPAAIAKLAAECPELFTSATDVYEVGRVLCLLQGLGYSHSAVLNRIVPLYPQLLTKHVDRDLLPVLNHLASLGCSEADVRLLVWEFVRVFISPDYQRHVRQFQVLGLYNLPPPVRNTAARSQRCDDDSLSRLMHL